MHIGFLTTEYPPLPSGGIGTSIRTLARTLVAQGHRVTVVGWAATDTRFEDEGVQVHFLEETRLPKMGWLLNRRSASALLNRLVRDEGLDIVETHDWTGPSAGMRLHCPLVVRCHGSATYFAHLLKEKVRPSVRWAERIAIHRADAVVAVSRFTARITAQLFGVRREIGVIPNGVNINRFRPGQSGEIEPHTILYFGTLVRKKGVLDLCRAFSRVVEAEPQARLRLVGRDAADARTGSPSTWALCKELLSPDALDRVEYMGAKPHDDIQTYIRKAALCLFPSYAEAMPVSWLEAMACAKPIIAYDVGWASEVVKHKLTGLLVATGDRGALASAMRNILADPMLGASMGNAGRAMAETNFTADSVAKKTTDLYLQVLSKPQK